jgi:hypothetical protein
MSFGIRVSSLDCPNPSGDVSEFLAEAAVVRLRHVANHSEVFDHAKGDGGIDARLRGRNEDGKVVEDVHSRVRIGGSLS